MSKPFRARKFLKALLFSGLGCALLLLLAFFSSPWWLGAALTWLGPHYGITVGEYERMGYNRFALKGLRYESDGLKVELQEFQAPSLPIFSINQILAVPSRLSLKNGVIKPYETKSAEVPTAETNDGGFASTLSELSQAYDTLKSWHLLLDIQDLRYLADGGLITLLSLHSIEDSLKGVLSLEKPAHDINFLISRNAGQSSGFDAELSSGSAKLLASIQPDHEDEADLTGTLQWQSETADFSASWQGADWMPQAATLNAENWTLPDSLLAAEDRHGYAAPMASLEASWDGSSYSLSLEAKAEAKEGGLPTLRATVEIAGNLDELHLQSMNIEGDWITGELYEPVTIPFTGLKDLPPMGFALAADFSRQNFFPLKGQAEMRLLIDDRPGEAYPLVTALFGLKKIEYEAYDMTRLQAETELDWPLLEVKRFEAVFPQNSSFEASGSYDIQADTVTALKADLSLTEALAKELALPLPKFNTLSAEVEVNGPRSQALHEGTIRIQDLSWANELIDIELSWRGQHGVLEVLSGKGGSDALDLSWEGSAELTPEHQSLTMTEAQVASRDFHTVTLQKPFTITRSHEDEVLISPLSLQGNPEERLTLEGKVKWPDAGRLSISANNLKQDWLALVSDARLPFPIDMKSLDLTAHWHDGPIEFTLETEATGKPDGQQPVTLVAKASSQGQGISLDTLRLTQTESLLAEAQGEFPLQIDLSDPEYISVDKASPVALSLAARPGATPLWRWLQKRYQLTLQQPRFSLEVSGGLNSPEGSLEASFTRLAFAEESGLPHVPELTQLDTRVSFNPEAISVADLNLAISGHRLEFTANQPMSEASWLSLLLEGKAPDIKEASAKLNFEAVPLAVFSEYLPAIVRPSGQLSIHATLQPGLDWRGTLQLEEAETFPVQNLGSLSNINADLELVGSTLTVSKASTLVGGRELAILGKVHLPELNQPRFDLQLQGEKVPLTRSAGLIVRGSPDLTLKTDEDDITTLGGIIRLDESFYTIDLASFTQSNANDPNRRFPYFSIDEKPLADWRLDIEVEGESFLRVRTPVFEGQVSADLELRGTLLEPLATGQASIVKGVVLFPFASLRIQQGTVTIRQDDPFQPVLDIAASGRAYGYDVTMRLTGSPEEPQLAFSSTPALEQGDILLMLTAGRMPESDQRSTGSRLTGLGIFIGNTLLADMGIIDPLDDELQVFVGEDVTETGRDTIRVIYRINETWSLVGEYDRFDEYTLDAHWTIYQE